MISKVSHDEIVDAIWIHWRLQLGSYFESIHDLAGAIYNLGGRVQDYYWNYAGLISAQTGSEDELVERIVDFADSHEREPAFYIDPTSAPDTIGPILHERGFRPEDEEIWMFFDPAAPPASLGTNDLEVRRVVTPSEMESFITLFNHSYEMDDQNDYALSLRNAFESPPSRVEVHHYVGYLKSVPVTIGSVYVSGDVAGLYNVGTPPGYRRQGFGSTISHAAVQDSLRSRKLRRILLQTELGTSTEELYRRLGFRQAFSAAIWAITEGD